MSRPSITAADINSRQVARTSKLRGLTVQHIREDESTRKVHDDAVLAAARIYCNSMRRNVCASGIGG